MTFREGKIIDKMNLEDGREIIIRYPKKADLKAVWKFYNKVVKETEFLSRKTLVSLRDEKKWLDDTLLKSKKKNIVQLFVETEDKIIGSCSVIRNNTQVTAHTGVYGICILQEFTGKGIGKRITKNILDLAKNEMKLEAVQLNVFSDNDKAKKMYESFGFRDVGILPGWIKQRTKTKDDIIMYKVLKV